MNCFKLCAKPFPALVENTHNTLNNLQMATKEDGDESDSFVSRSIKDFHVAINKHDTMQFITLLNRLVRFYIVDANNEWVTEADRIMIRLALQEATSVSHCSIYYFMSLMND
jgi:hypothetical protein